MIAQCQFLKEIDFMRGVMGSSTGEIIFMLLFLTQCDIDPRMYGHK